MSTFMDKQALENCLKDLNEKLKHKEIMADMHLYGGAVMCLAFDAQPGTHDIDAVFMPQPQNTCLR